jgi:membrane protein implicated in regulation of membrane protease activity
MRSVRESYDLPERPPTPFRQWAVMLALPAFATGLWLVLPDSPVTVALLAIAVLVAVFVGVGMVLRSRELDEKPGRDPVTPPSVDRG